MKLSQHVRNEGRRHLIPSVLFRIGSVITTPPPIGDGGPANALPARTLHSLLLGVMLWLVLCSVVGLPFFATRKAAGSALLIVLALSVLTSLISLNRGHVKLASWIFLSGIWFVVTIVTIFSGGIASRGLMCYIAISVTAAWLVGQLVALISAALFAGMTLALALLEMAGVHLPQYFPGSPFVVLMTVLLFLAIAILPVSQVLRVLSNALEEAHQRLEELKHREKALQESQQRCCLAMETGRMYAFEWNPHTDEVKRSYNCADITGSATDATWELGKDSYKRVHPEDQARLSRTIKSLTHANETYQIQYRVIRPGGQIATFQQSGRGFFDNAGVMVRLIGIIADVTEQKRTESALQESEQRLNAIFSQAAVGIAQASIEGEWLLLNDHYCEILGYTQDELRGRSFLDITHPEDRAASHAGIQGLLAGEASPRLVERRYVRKDGTLVWVKLFISLVRDPASLPRYFIAVAEDVTERKRAEEALRENEQRLVAIYNTVRDVIFYLAVEPEGQFRFISVNAAFLRVTGLSLKTVIGKTVHEVIPEPSLTMVLRKYRQAIEEHDVVHWEETSDYPTGRLTGEVSIAPVFDDKGTCTHLVGSVHDITERKQAEEARAHLASIVESSDEAIIGETVEGVVVSWNPGAERMYGYKAEEMLSQPVSLLVPPERVEEIPRILQRLRHGERLERCEIIGVRKDGRRIEVSITLSPITDSTGTVVGVSAISHDITERKRTEALLRESEEHFRQMADTAPVMIWISGLDKLCTFVNKGRLDFTGRTLEQELGNGWVINVHPDDVDRCVATYFSSFDALSSFQIEYRMRRADGEYRWVLDNGKPFYKRGEFTGYIGSCIDVTDQKLAQDKLRASERRLAESEERLKSAQRLAHVGNWAWDMKANRVHWSEELCRIFGRASNYSPDYAAFLQAVQPQDRERVDQSIRDSLAGKKRSGLLEFQIARPDGEVRTIAGISEVLRDTTGSPVSMSGACQDVTDQRGTEAALRRSLDEMAHLNRMSAMSELATSLAHELNQPLAAILLNSRAASQFLSGQPPNLARVSNCLNAIAADDERAGEVIRRLRVLLKKGEFQPSSVDLNEVVSDVIRLMEHDALLRHVSVKSELLAGTPPVLGDRIQLYQVVLNLIMNSLDAVAERPPADRRVSVRTSGADGGGVELTVEDSGKGIAESDLTRVFEPFFTTKQQGLGMGLSISQSIMQAHGGRIWAENSVGAGAIFRCWLPAAMQVSAASAK